MRRLHFLIGILGVIAFVLSGQRMFHQQPPTSALSGELRMMYVSRHIYLLGGSLVNLVLGLYLETASVLWRRAVQGIGSALILASPVLLGSAFLTESPLGVAGRGWRSRFGLIGLFLGVLMHLVGKLGARRIDTTP